MPDNLHPHLRIPGPDAVISAAGRLRTARPDINPDTGQPLPSPRPDDEQLVADLLDRYDDRLDYDNQRRVLEEVITEAVVRARTRGLRETRDAAKATADSHRAQAARSLDAGAADLAAGLHSRAADATGDAAFHLAAAETLARHFTL
jgi:hypothetical protein